MGVLALGLGLLTLGGAVQLWQVYAFALLLGCVTAFDSPARQTFVAEMVGEADLSNAVALNSTSFNAARMIGPAVAGLLIAGVGTGGVFLINAASFAAVLVALWRLRVADLHRTEKALRTRGSLADGFRYVRQRPDLMAVLFMLLSVFHAGAGTYGLLTSTMAIGSIAGALLAAQRDKPGIRLLMISAGVFGVGCTLAALMPNELLFAAALVIIGISAQTFTTSTLSLAQMATAPAMRGRVIAIVLAIAMGGTPIGAPIVGWVADTLGPRWALAIGGASGLGAALVAIRYLAKYRHLQVCLVAGRLRISTDDGDTPSAPAPLR
jgi:MFS family permease